MTTARTVVGPPPATMPPLAHRARGGGVVSTGLPGMRPHPAGHTAAAFSAAAPSAGAATPTAADLPPRRGGGGGR
ncbi:hypothetical protein [Dactylosporangium sp. NPDC050588]|uniref:hypothetical protein n=1 Tax=Dactylosporangium sp. NPDC050588 TaxID=3157211 RepID=UPI0033C515E2